MSSSKYELNDNPYLRVYPELNVFELPFAAFMLAAISISIPFLIWNGVYHVLHLLGFSVGPEKILVARSIVSDQMLADPVMGRLISLGFIVVTVFYVYLLVFLMKRMYSPFRRNLTRLKMVSPSTWNSVRARRLVAHLLYGQVAFWIVFLSIWWVWGKYVLPAFDGVIIPGGIFIVAFFVIMFFGELLRSTPRGQRILDGHFRVVGGYEDGSIGRRLHGFRTLEDSYSKEEIELLVPPELFDTVVNVSELEDEEE